MWATIDADGQCAVFDLANSRQKVDKLRETEPRVELMAVAREVPLPTSLRDALEPGSWR